jgi:hypothetical protein
LLTPVGLHAFPCAVTKSEQLSSQSGVAAREVLPKAEVPGPSRTRQLGWFGLSVIPSVPLQICSVFGFRNKFRVVLGSAHTYARVPEREAPVRR